MSKTIFLVGARAAGKTTVGKLLAEYLHCSFIDTDHFLTATTRKTIAQIVEQEGWSGFRKIESEILQEVTQANRVIATGGGIILAEKNRVFMQENGNVLYLSATAEILAKRLSADPNMIQRPSLTGLSIINEIAQILTERQALYIDTADYILDANKSAQEILKDIKQLF